jgi:tripartite-type tricarboxylate transporter receptor subunit TctC
MKVSLALSAALVAAVAVSAPARAEYPERTINLLLGFPAGGNIDIAARQAQPFLEKYLGNGAKIAVINRDGAAGAVMNTELAAAKPDGYTVGLLSSPGLWTVLFGANFKYSPDSYDYFGTLVNEPYTIFVHWDSPYQSLKDLVAAAKAQPGTINISAAGTASAPHLGLMAFENVAKAKFNYVAVKGAADMLTGVMGKHFVGGVTTVTSVMPRHEEKQLRVLGLMAEKRWDLAPQIPTFKDEGFDHVWGATRGFGGPKGLPKDVYDKWHAAVKKTFDDPEFKKLSERDRQMIEYMDGKAFEANSKKQYANLEAMWKADPWKK